MKILSLYGNGFRVIHFRNQIKLKSSTWISGSILSFFQAYDPELFSKALPCLSAIACALSPDYSLSHQDSNLMRQYSSEADDSYVPKPAEIVKWEIFMKTFCSCIMIPLFFCLSVFFIDFGPVFIFSQIVFLSMDIYLNCFSLSIHSFILYSIQWFLIYLFIAIMILLSEQNWVNS